MKAAEGWTAVTAAAAAATELEARAEVGRVVVATAAALVEAVEVVVARVAAATAEARAGSQRKRSARRPRHTKKVCEQLLASHTRLPFHSHLPRPTRP